MYHLEGCVKISKSMTVKSPQWWRDQNSMMWPSSCIRMR